MKRGRRRPVRDGRVTRTLAPSGSGARACGPKAGVTSDAVRMRLQGHPGEASLTADPQFLDQACTPPPPPGIAC
jgi:hypothetical protein